MWVITARVYSPKCIQEQCMLLSSGDLNDVGLLLVWYCNLTRWKLITVSSRYTKSSKPAFTPWEYFACLSTNHCMIFSTRYWWNARSQINQAFNQHRRIFNTNRGISISKLTISIATNAVQIVIICNKCWMLTTATNFSYCNTVSTKLRQWL